MEGQYITFRARVHTQRKLSAKMTFIVFRQQTMTVQGLLQTEQPDAAGGEQHIRAEPKPHN